MDAEPDALSEKKPDLATLDSASSASRHPTSPSGITSIREASAASSASREALPNTIKASSGLSPRRSSARSPTPAAAAAAASSSGTRRSPLSAASGRRPLPGSAPSQAASSANPSAQPAPDALTSKMSASATIAHKEKMNESEKGGMDKAESQSQSNLPFARRGSIAARASSTSSSIPANVLEDEIVVGTKTNGIHSSPIHVVSEHEDVEMEDKNHSPEPPYPKRKRSSIYSELEEEKSEQSVSRDIGNDSPSATAAARIGDKVPKPIPQPSVTTQRSITLGYWRDSAVPDEYEKHAVVGFIDTRDRLRTRIQQSSRSGKFVAADYPLPPGPGGSWVTFERVVFDKHLVGLDHNQVKEYVKIRSENSMAHDSSEDGQASDKAAVKEAIRRAALHPTPDNVPPPAIAYGVDLPDYVVNAIRPEKKRRMASNGTFGAFSTAAEIAANMPSSQQNLAPAGGSPSVASAIQRSAIDLLPGTRPTKILLGYWRGSSEERVEDKHAVFGILGANDMFRVKVTRETRDGRPVMGNFPTGAGALWIHYDEVEFEKHIRHLSRPEVKEYVRVRQRQIDEGEKPDQRIENETKAVYDAQARVISAGGVAQSTLGTAGRVDTISFASAANLNSRHADSSNTDLPSHTYQQDGRARREYEPRQTRRSYAADSRDGPASIATAAMSATPPQSRSGRHSLPDGIGMTTELRPANRPPSTGHGASEGSKTLPGGQNGSGQNADRVERTNSLARREVVRVESIQMRNEQRAANRETGLVGGGSTASGVNSAIESTSGVLPSQIIDGNAANGSGAGNTGNNGASSRLAFSENIGRLNKVWASQEASRLRAGGEDAKIYLGVKYERKQTGPFQGKLVSPGTILSIDGEDYVEYRVLTKPTFF